MHHFKCKNSVTHPKHPFGISDFIVSSLNPIGILYILQLAQDGCVATFTSTMVTITRNNNNIITRKMDPNTQLYLTTLNPITSCKHIPHNHINPTMANNMSIINPTLPIPQLVNITTQLYFPYSLFVESIHSKRFPTHTPYLNEKSHQKVPHT